MGTLKIFILHGWTYDIEKWDGFVSLLKKDYHVELLKIPGLTAKLESAYTIEDYVEWLKNEIAREEKVVLIGHSNGGRLASFFASLHPEKVSHLILIDSAGIYHKDIGITLKRLVFKNIAKFGKKISKSKILEKLLYKAAREKDYMKASPILKKTMENLIKSDVTPHLPNIKSKTLIIWGRNDKATPLSDGLRMHELIPNSKLEIIEARHSPQFTNPIEITKLITSFLS